MNKKQEKAIIEFVKLIDKNIEVEFQEGPLECDPLEEIVYIGTALTKEEDDLFMNFIKELEPAAIKYNPFLMGLLHEIGHIMTYDEDLDKDRDEQYALMQVAHKFGLVDTDTLNKEYFRIPLELNATQWGVNFAMSNQDIMEKYNKIIIGGDC